MRTKLVYLFIAFTFAIFSAEARNVVKVKASNYDISDNLDLKAVASIFGESDNLAEFERRLNDEGNEISNLDLNEDGYIDYLRVIEVSNNRDHLVIIQSVLGEDIYQDVATIELKNENDRYTVLIVGNDFIYGTNYIIEPVYYHRPTIFGFFFGPLYQPWHSPYYWGYYPTYYSYRRPYPVYRYRNHIDVHINSHNHYNYHASHNNHHSNDYYNKYSRNDYGSKHPDKSFDKRNDGYSNKQELNQNRRSERPNSKGYKTMEKPVSNGNFENRRPSSVEKGRKTTTPSMNKSTPVQEQRRSGNSERSVSQPSQNKLKSIENPAPKKVENKPVSRERSVPEKAQQQRSKPEVGNTTNRRTESKAKQQSTSKTVEKSAPVKKENENKSRR